MDVRLKRCSWCDFRLWGPGLFCCAECEEDYYAHEEEDYWQ